MPAQIATLIDKRDNAEFLRDELAAILLVESKRQQQLASAAGKDATQWALRVFVERANPWAEFEDATRADLDTSPLVNVSLDAVSYDLSKSDLHYRQHAVATYNLDCYGFGRSTERISGHDPGDARAALEAQRAVRLVRNILMSAHWSYLGHRGLVARRWPTQLDIFQPQIDQRPVPHVVAARLALEVQFNEFSPQHVPETLEAIALEVRRNEVTGQLLLAAQFQY